MEKLEELKESQKNLIKLFENLWEFFEKLGKF